MRRERARTPGACSWRSGSSPHARGTLPRLAPTLQHLRFIPACAGNASCDSPRSCRNTVHPRMRGERHPCSIMAVLSPGSSPHARGTPAAADGKTFRDRFIPACAGNASPHRPRRSPATVHPRMRGERDAWRMSKRGYAGSSPHARGTLHRNGLLHAPFRFIPACAGNADADVGCRVVAAVHPRMRGERTSSKLLIYRRKSEPSDSTNHSGY